jgi:hypothetical protein
MTRTATLDSRREATVRLTKPTFAIVHRFWKPETICMSGEEVFAAWLEIDGQEVQLRLPLALRLLFNYLATHRLAQSASQIEAGMRDPFYSRHAKNSGSSTNLTRRMARSSVKTYIARLRTALQIAFDEAGVALNSTEILVSQATVGLECGYQLRAAVRFVHLP